MAVTENVRINFEAGNLDVVEARIKTIGGAINILGGAVETTVGLLGMVGVDEKQTKKFQEMATSAIALADGTKRIFEGYKELREAMELFTKAQVAQTAAQQASNTAAVTGAGAFDKLRIAMIKNPITAIVVGLTALAGAIYLFSQRTSEAEEQQQKFNDALDQSTADIQAEVLAIRQLNAVIQDSSVPLDQRKQAYEELQKLVPSLTTYTFQEALANKQLNDQIENQIKLLNLKARVNVVNKLYEEEYLTFLKELKDAEKLTYEQRQRLRVDPQSLEIPDIRKIITVQGNLTVSKSIERINTELIESQNNLKFYTNLLNGLTTSVNALNTASSNFQKKGSLYKAPVGPKFIPKKDVDDFKEILSIAIQAETGYLAAVKKLIDRSTAQRNAQSADFKNFSKILADTRNTSAAAQLETLRGYIKNTDQFNKIIEQNNVELILGGKKTLLSLKDLAKQTEKGAFDLTLAYKLLALPKEVLGLNEEQFKEYRTNIVQALKDADKEIQEQLGKFPDAFKDQGDAVRAVGQEIIRTIELSGDAFAEKGKELVDKFNASLAEKSPEQFKEFLKSLTDDEKVFVDETTRTLKIGATNREAFLKLYIKLYQDYKKELKNEFEDEVNARIEQGIAISEAGQDVVAKLQALAIRQNDVIGEATRTGKTAYLNEIKATFNEEATAIITEGFAKQKERLDFEIGEFNEKMGEIEFPDDVIVPEDVQPMLDALDKLQTEAQLSINSYYDGLKKAAQDNGFSIIQIEKDRDAALLAQGDNYRKLRLDKEKQANQKILDNQKTFNEQTKNAEDDRIKKQIALLDKYIAKATEIAGKESEQVKNLIALRGKLSDSIKGNAIDLGAFFAGPVGRTISGSLQALSAITGAALEIAVQESEQRLNQIEADAQERAKNVTGTEEEVAYQLEVIEYEKNVALEAERKRAFEDQKKFRIADTITTGFASAFQAFGGAMSLGPIAGPIIGGILAGAILAMMAKTVQSIQKQQYIGTAPTPPRPPQINTSGATSAGGTATATLGGQFNQPIPNPNDPGNQQFGSSGNPMNSPNGMGMGSQPIRAYVVSSDVSNGLQAEQQLQNRRRL